MLDLNYVDNNQFYKCDAIKILKYELPPGKPHVTFGKTNLGYECKTVLTKSEEIQLFLKYNYIKYRIQTKRLNQKQINHLTEIAIKIKQDIILCNTGLLMMVSGRAVDKTNRIADLVHEACIVLSRCIEKFDVSKGFKFSTYATHSMQRALWYYKKDKSVKAKSLPRHVKVFDPFSDMDVEEVFPVKTNLETLKPREQQIIIRRFGLDGKKPATLHELGRKYSLTKERVRQIQMRAVSKLRKDLSSRYSMDDIF